jgi:hypothetical protein
MKNKKVTYLLGLLVILVWSTIIYRIVVATQGDDADSNLPEHPARKAQYNDYALKKDTGKLLMNYRDPFGLQAEKDTVVHVSRSLPISRLTQQTIAKPTINWSFLKYSGFVRNAGSKKLIALVTINGNSQMLNEGETKDQVKLLKNLKDSIKVSYQGKTRFIVMHSPN